MTSLRSTQLFACGLLLFALGACEGGAPTGPHAAATPAFAASDVAALLECPIHESSSATSVLGAAGGAVSVEGATIVVPAGALLRPTSITLTVPASAHVEVDITADGAEHFEFRKLVAITIGYGRCRRSDILQRPLEAWHIDETTKALLKEMGGIDDKLARTVTFHTGHLSGYAIAE